MAPAQSERDPSGFGSARMAALWKRLGQLLCLVGLHDFRTIDVTYGFGQGGSVAKVECRRCGFTTTRSTG